MIKKQADGTHEFCYTSQTLNWLIVDGQHLKKEKGNVSTCIIGNRLAR